MSLTRTEPARYVSGFSCLSPKNAAEIIVRKGCVGNLELGMEKKYNILWLLINKNG